MPIDYMQFADPYNPGDPGTLNKFPPAKTPLPQDASDIAAKRLDIEKQRQEQIDKPLVENLQRLQQQYSDVSKRKTIVPPDPKFTEPTPRPPQNFSDPIAAFQNPGVLIATLGSFFSRAPMTAALNAGGAAMEAYHKGEAEVFALRRQEWEDNLKVALEKNKIALDKYNVAWNKSDAATKDKLAQLQGILASEKMTSAIAAIESGHFDRVDEMFKSLQKSQDTLEQIRERAKFPHSTSPQTIAVQKYLEENPNASPEQLQRFISAGRYGRSALGIYMNQYLAENPEATADDIKARAQEFQTQTTAQNRFFSGPQGNTIRSLNVVVSHLDTMKQLGEALGNGNLPAFNRIAQRFAEETGQPAPTNFDTAKQIVGAEIIKALGVAGAGTQAERAEAADAFNRARSPEQMVGAIGVAQALLGGQLQGLRRQFTASTGLAGDRFDEMLEPHTREFLDRNTKPTLDSWLPKARSANPGVSDDELIAAFNQKYGNK